VLLIKDIQQHLSKVLGEALSLELVKRSMHLLKSSLEERLEKFSWFKELSYEEKNCLIFYTLARNLKDALILYKGYVISLLLPEFSY